MVDNPLDPLEVSPSGQPVLRYGEPKPAEFAVGSSETIDAVDRHIARYIGEPISVFHEVISTFVHIDVHVVPPGEGRPFATIVTSGMSDRAMNAPEGLEKFQHCELLMQLPPDWPLSSKTNDEPHLWPLNLLKFLARFPHAHDTWLWQDHTVPNGDPPESFASDTTLCCAMLTYPTGFDREFVELQLPDRTVAFWSVMLLHHDEMEYKLRYGAKALYERFGKSGVGQRPSCCPPKKRWTWPWRRRR